MITTSKHPIFSAYVIQIRTKTWEKNKTRMDFKKLDQFGLNDWQVSNFGQLIHLLAHYVQEI